MPSFVEIHGLSQLIPHVSRLGSRTKRLTKLKVQEQTTILARTTRRNITRLFHNPEKMRSAIGWEVQEQGDEIIGTVDASGRISGVILPYMRIQEEGGTVDTPEIFPKDSRALLFFSGSHGGTLFDGKIELDKVYAQHTRAHETRIPQRSYLHTALEERREAILRAFDQIGHEAWIIED